MPYTNAEHLRETLPTDDNPDVEAEAAPDYCRDCGEVTVPNLPCENCAEDAALPASPWRAWECDPEGCRGCGRCYQRLGEGVCAENCHHGLRDFAEETAAWLAGGGKLDDDPDVTPRLVHTLLRFVAIVEAAEDLRAALNSADTWAQAVEACERQDVALHLRDNAALKHAAAVAAVVPARANLGKVMDGR